MILKQKPVVSSSSETSYSWLTRACHRLKGILRRVWGAVIAAVIVNTIASVSLLPVNTSPTELTIVHFVLTFPIPAFSALGIFLLLTLFAWVGGHKRNTAPLPSHHQSPLSNGVPDISQLPPSEYPLNISQSPPSQDMPNTSELPPSEDIRERRALYIILAFAVAHAAVSGVLANTVIGDVPLLAGLTTLMVTSLAKLSGKNLKVGAIVGIAGSLSAQVAGLFLLAKSTTWIPIIGNGVNAAIAFSLSQVVGWAAYYIFSKGVSEEEAIAYAKKKETSQEEMRKIENKMTKEDKSRYKSLKRGLLNPFVLFSEKKQQEVVSEIAKILQKYL